MSALNYEAIIEEIKSNAQAYVTAPPSHLVGEYTTEDLADEYWIVLVGYALDMARERYIGPTFLEDGSVNTTNTRAFNAFRESVILPVLAIKDSWKVQLH